MVLGVRTYLKLVAGLGFEPRYSPPEGEVLPLDDPALLRNTLCAPQCGEQYPITRVYSIGQMSRGGPSLIRWGKLVRMFLSNREVLVGNKGGDKEEYEDEKNGERDIFVRLLFYHRAMVPSCRKNTMWITFKYR